MSTLQVPEAPTVRNCVTCGRAIDWRANVCPYCGHDYRAVMMPQLQAKKGSLPVIGGVLIVIAGVLALAMGGLYLTLDAADVDDYGVALPADLTTEEFADFMHTCGIVLLVFGAIAMVGGAFGIMRRHFGLALVGGIFGLLGVGMIIGSILGLIGLILVAVSRKDFD
ncbi:MAG: hypothetical protein A3K67_04090 [Euryarchaeota archaeon RBG_16_62_10]|nr:MAG: hypothetical protein A3K67_04090 [Euryarchaeota archaeon RBG_16_62_10]